MAKGKIHLEWHRSIVTSPSPYVFAICGHWEYADVKKSRMTDFPSKVTCKKCLKQLAG